MGQELTTAEKLRRLPWSIIGSATNATYCQLTFFGSLFVLFLSQLGLSKTTIGWLLSLIPFFGLIAVFIAPNVARRGYKPVFIAFWGIRKIATLGLLFIPWVLAHYGPGAMLAFAVATVAGFSFFRAVAITAYYPWTQEYVPDSVRGKYSAVNQVSTALTGFLAITAASYYLGPEPGLQRFVLLFAVGTAIGLISVAAYVNVPGGAPARSSLDKSVSYRSLLQVAGDPNLVPYLVGTGLVTLSSAGLGSFVPLFMREAVGLTTGQVVLVQGATLIGGFLTSFVWGWAADRYGSRPVTLLGVFLTAILPVFWFAMPRGTGLSLPLALGTFFWQGFANMGWVIGSTRLLYVDVVPSTSRTAYMAIYYASASLVEGLSQLLSGRVLDTWAGVRAEWLGFVIDRYSLLFAAGLILPLLGSLLLRRVHTDHTVSVARFAGMFLQGNPLLAMESLIGYQIARDESAAVSVTERLGRARSPLTVDELAQALSDPRFNVRFEAVVSMAHHGADPRLTDALVDTLHGRDPALSTLAAWALGRSRDREAIPALRQGLQARYRSVQAHCARSLATLGDADSAPGLLQRLLGETDEGLQLAYAAALGTLRYQPATPKLLTMLWEEAHRQPRMELALALARIVGEERFFVNLARQLGGEKGTALSQAVDATCKKLNDPRTTGDLRQIMSRCAEVWAREELEPGVALLVDALTRLPLTETTTPAGQVLQASVAGMRRFGMEREEYVLLALHTLACSTT